MEGFRPTPEQRRLTALTDDGKRVDPGVGRRRFAVVKFDEERKSPAHTLPCLDCDGAGCEKCGGTGRRWVP